MKRLLIVAAVMLQTVTAAGTAFAQVEEPKYLRLPHRFQIFLQGGGALPTRPSVWNDLWNSGFEFTIGGGASIFSWLEITGGYSTMSFALNTLQAKSTIGYQGLQEVEGGTISTSYLFGTARFIAVPKARTNPYAEVMVGYFSTSAEDVVIEGVLQHSMEDVSGLAVAPMFGLQYALADYWTAYARYSYMVNLNDAFAPGDLVQPVSGSRDEPEGNQVIQTLSVGIMLRF